MKIFLSISLALLCLSTYADEKKNVETNNEGSFTWSNPLRNFYYLYSTKLGSSEVIRELRDPAIIREGDVYYLIFTHYPFTHHTSKDADKPDMNSSPGIRIYSTKDFIDFKSEGWLVKSSELPDNCPYKHRFWAPEIHKINNKYYLIFTADNWINPSYCPTGQNGLYTFIGVSNNVTGPYEHITYLPDGACDTSLFQDDSGITYAVMPKGNEQWVQEIDLCRLEEGILSLKGKATSILSRVGHYPFDDWPDTIEGPWLIKRGGKYILFSAAAYRNTDPMEYWTEVAISDNLSGPYTAYPKIFPGGHIGVFTGPDGKDWFSVRGEKRGQSGFAELNISPIPFTENWDLETFPLVPGIQTISWEETSSIFKISEIDINPIIQKSKGYFSVLFEDLNEKSEIVVYKLTGEKLLSKHLAYDNHFSLEYFPSGIYLAKLFHNGYYYSCKIIN